MDENRPADAAAGHTFTHTATPVEGGQSGLEKNRSTILKAHLKAVQHPCTRKTAATNSKYDHVTDQQSVAQPILPSNHN